MTANHFISKDEKSKIKPTEISTIMYNKQRINFSEKILEKCFSNN